MMNITSDDKLAVFCEQRRFNAAFKEPYMDVPETVVLFYVFAYNFVEPNPQLLQVKSATASS